MGKITQSQAAICWDAPQQVGLPAIEVIQELLPTLAARSLAPEPSCLHLRPMASHTRRKSWKAPALNRLSKRCSFYISFLNKAPLPATRNPHYRKKHLGALDGNYHMRGRFFFPSDPLSMDVNDLQDVWPKDRTNAAFTLGLRAW